MMMMPAVILAIQDEDDRRYMEWVFQTYHKLMYYYIMEVIKNPWTADDVMQECVVKLIHKIDTIRQLSESKRRNYIITTAKNTSISYLRRTASQKGTSYDEWAKDCVGTDPEDDPEDLILHQEEIRQLQLVWDKLDERSKFVLSGRYILDRSFDELAQDLNVSPASVRMMLTRAKRAALELMRKEMHKGPESP